MDDQTLLTQHLNALSNQRIEEMERYILPSLGNVRRSKEERVALILDYCKNPEVANKIFSTVSERDATILTAVAWLKKPNILFIQELLPQYSWQEITETLYSLRQRLLVGYDKERKLFALNFNLPIRQKICHGSTITKAEKHINPPVTPFRNHFWVGLLVSCAGLKSDKRITTRDYQKLTGVFPDLKDITLETLQDMIQGLFSIGAMSENGIIQQERIIKFSKKPNDWRIRSIQEATLKIKNLSIQDLQLIVPSGWRVAKNQYLHLIRIYCKDRDIDILPELLIQKMIAIKVLQETDTHYFSPAYYKEIESEKAVITGEMSFAISPLFPLQKIAPILPLLKTTHSDTLTHFEITKNTFIQSCKAGISLKTALEQLATIFPEYHMGIIEQTLQRWEAEYKQFSIVRGIILDVATPSKGYMKIPDLAPYILERLSSNRYLMSAEHETEWREILITRGVSDIFDPMIKLEQKPSQEIKNQKSDHYAEWSPVPPQYTESDQPTPKYANIGDVGITVTGADFQGKLHMITDAIKEKNRFLLLTIPNESGEEEITIYPIKTLADEGKTLIQGIVIPTREVTTIALNRVFSITTIKGHQWMNEFTTLP